MSNIDSIIEQTLDLLDRKKFAEIAQRVGEAKLAEYEAEGAPVVARAAVQAVTREIVKAIREA